MSKVISSFIPFPNLYWWSVVMEAGKVIFDAAEHFEKMTYRNKYYIAGANGVIQLSIPLAGGRNQRSAMKDMSIADIEQWQTQHWRGIEASYRRTPYYEHYAPELELLFKKEYTKLADFNQDSIDFLKKQLGLRYEEEIAGQYKAKYEEATIDMRKGFKPGIEQKDSGSLYYQPFEERGGFKPNLSMLDLLMCEGPNAVNVIKANEVVIKEWGS